MWRRRFSHALLQNESESRQPAPAESKSLGNPLLQKSGVAWQPASAEGRSLRNPLPLAAKPRAAMGSWLLARCFCLRAFLPSDEVQM